MTPPSEEPRYPEGSLRLQERINVALFRRMNRPGLLLRLGLWWNGFFGQRFFRAISRRRWRVSGQSNLDVLEPQAGILIVANHRSFFDLFIGATAIRELSNQRLGRPCVFPVRAPFFYDSLLALPLNLLASGGCMWPPIFRDARRKTLNPVSFAIMQSLLRRPRLCLGMHPEGRRGKGADPFTLGEAKPGVGRLIQSAAPETMILPLFITGLSNSIGQEISEGLRGAKGAPIDLCWGAARPASAYAGQEPEEITDAVMEQLRGLAADCRARSAR